MTPDAATAHVRRVAKRLGDAIAAFATAVEVLDADVRARVTAIPSLHYRLVGDPMAGLLRQLQTVEADLAARVAKIVAEHGVPRPRSAPNRMTLDRLGTVERSQSGRRRVWHGGQQVARRVALRTVDRSRFDPETGGLREDPVPPAVLAEMIADEITACAGLGNASASWRTGELETRGIDPDEFSEMEGEGRPTARWV